jgi:hypothetical protein
MSVRVNIIISDNTLDKGPVLDLGSNDKIDVEEISEVFFDVYIAVSRSLSCEAPPRTLRQRTGSSTNCG